MDKITVLDKTIKGNGEILWYCVIATPSGTLRAWMSADNIIEAVATEKLDLNLPQAIEPQFKEMLSKGNKQKYQVLKDKNSITLF